MTTPSSWPSWHPSSLGVSGATDHPLTVGEAVTEQFRVAGREGTVTWTVVAREPDHRWVIRGSVAGGGEGVIAYTLVARAGGTHFERDFDYSFRRPWLILVNRLRIRDRVTAESAEALRRVRAVLESPGSR